MKSVETEALSLRQAIWQEAQRLSQKVLFNFERGCFLEGERVCILADVEPEEEKGWYRVGVTVFPLGAMRPDMTGFPVTLRGDTESGLLLVRPGETNRRGHVTFHRLPAGKYALRFPLACSRSEEPVPAASRTLEQLTARTLAVRTRGAPLAVRTRGALSTANKDLAALPLAAATRAEEEAGWLEPKIYSSPEDPVQCTVCRTVEDRLKVAFETRQAGLAGAQVWFAFVEPETERLLLEAEVTLAETEEAGIWEGVWWSEPGFRLEAEGELVFEVVGGIALDEKS